MKILVLSLSWFFIGIAYVLVLVADTSGQGGTQITSIQLKLPFFYPAAKGTTLGATQSVDELIIDDAGVLEQETQLEIGDARPQLVAKFLERYNSPMMPHDEFGVFFVQLADKYGIDFRLLPAISMQESGLCKSIPPGSFNCLGLGVHSRGTWGFNSYQENFEAAAKILKNNYIDIGLTTPEQIMKKYTPSSKGSWASSVNQWMAEMRYNDRSLGRQLKTNASVLEFAQPSPVASEASRAANQ